MYSGYYFTEQGLFYKLDDTLIEYIQEYPELEKYYDDDIQSITGFKYDYERNKIVHDHYVTFCNFIRKYPNSVCTLCLCKHNNNNECISIFNKWHEFVNNTLINLQKNLLSTQEIIPETFDKFSANVRKDYKDIVQNFSNVMDIISNMKTKIDYLENKINKQNDTYQKIINKTLLSVKYCVCVCLFTFIINYF